VRNYTIIGGVNGVGKSSLSGVLKVERNDLGHIIDVDKLAVLNNLDAIESGKLAVARIEDYLVRGISFTQETTLSGVKTQRTIKKAKELGYTVRLLYIGLNTLEESKERIKNRVLRGGHNIQEDAVERRFSKRLNDVVKVLPYCDEAHFYDNDNGFVEVGEYRNGEIICKGDLKPEWFVELRDAFY
jgi:predicted ABC-type ATPase